MEGWIKDYRQELESDVWVMPPLYHRVWQFLKYSVNHTEAQIPMRNGTKFKISRGQHLTSYRGIARNVSWYEGKVHKEPNPKTIKTICEWLEKNEMIKQEHGKGNGEYTLITLLNWGLYQCDDNEGVTPKKQALHTKVTAKKQCMGTNKNEENKNNEENEKNEVYISAQHLSITKEEYDKLVSLYSKEEVDGKIEYARNYRNLKNYVSLYLTLNNWLKADKDPQKNKSTGNPFLEKLKEVQKKND